MLDNFITGIASTTPGGFLSEFHPPFSRPLYLAIYSLSIVARSNIELSKLRLSTILRAGPKYVEFTPALWFNTYMLRAKEQVLRKAEAAIKSTKVSLEPAFLKSRLPSVQVDAVPTQLRLATKGYSFDIRPLKVAIFLSGCPKYLGDDD